MKIDQLIQGLQVESRSCPKGREILGVACDSRQVRAGFLFVALAGQEKDGAQYVDDAVGRGAVAIVSERNVKVGGDACLLIVPDARKALAELSARFYDMPSEKLQVIGVTGTNGKSTTSFIARDILRVAGRSPGLLGTIEYQIGARVIPASRTTPDSPLLQSMLAQMLGAGCRSVVMEVSSHALEQKRVCCIDFDVAVFTNLTRDHLDYHGSMDCYFEAKKKLFALLGSMKKKASAVINIDDSRGKDLLGLPGQGCSKITFGLSPEADIHASDIVLGPTQTSFVLRSPWGAREIRSNMLGRFNVLNALGALASCLALGVDLDTSCSALSSLTVVPGRLEEVRTGRNYQVFVDYAHTDNALENVLVTLRELTRGRIIVVFGGGGTRDKTKRPVMGAIADKLADFSYLTSDNPRKEDPAGIIEEIKSGFGGSGNYEIVQDRAEAIRKALTAARDGDLVLIAGKGHEIFQEFANTTIPFDDRKIAQKILSENA
jgi:UDP-N-acetylmuramoyl-L-alanyl-D-glutamate--2,6-diaminopimelate ligase